MGQTKRRVIAPVLSCDLSVRAVIDTNVLVGALVGQEGFNRQILRKCLRREIVPLVGQALFLEYKTLLLREDLFRTSPLNAAEREELLHALLSVSEWVQIYFGWRPNLRDEGDNHVMELAVGGNAEFIITNNLRDFAKADLEFPNIRIIHPRDYLKERP